MELTIIKVILFLAFFATLATGAFWAGEKLEEYWGEDEE